MLSKKYYYNNSLNCIYAHPRLFRLYLRIVSRLACFWSCFDGCYYCPFMVTGYASQPSPPRIVHWTSNTQSQIYQKIRRNYPKMAAKHPKIGIFEKFNKQQAVKMKVSKGLRSGRKVWSWKSSKLEKIEVGKNRRYKSSKLKMFLYPNR